MTIIMKQSLLSSQTALLYIFLCCYTLGTDDIKQGLYSIIALP